MLEEAFRLAKRREELCKNVPPCPSCGEAQQIQLRDWIDKVEWKCRMCGHKYEGVSYEDKDRLLPLLFEMCNHAAKTGPMHSWWDIIFDVENFMAGRRTVQQLSMDGWVKECEGLLASVKRKGNG